MKWQPMVELREVEGTDYQAIFEQAPSGDWGAYVPALPGIACGAATLPETEELVRGAIALWLEDAEENDSLLTATVAQVVSRG